MRTALITTTINVPEVLALYRKSGPDVKFFVAADDKTPLEAYEFCAGIPDCEIYSPDRQRELGYDCSEPIGWNCIQRRNIALLEAVKWGAELIVTIDDDNIPVNAECYFCSYAEDYTWSGLKASSPSRWFDPGCLLVPQTKHRGFPVAIKSEPTFEAVTDARIGVVAGLCLGDPDIDAVTRIALHPTIHSVSELARAGVVVDPDCHTVFNSQNTTFLRELAPAMFMMPGVGRYDDIYASLVCQRVMREHGLHVHFGQPFVWQQRNQHDLISDLHQEIDGMQNIKRFAECIDNIVLHADASVVDQVRSIYSMFEHAPPSYNLLPSPATAAALAFLDDMEQVL